MGFWKEFFKNKTAVRTLIVIFIAFIIWEFCRGFTDIKEVLKKSPTNDKRISNSINNNGKVQQQINTNGNGSVTIYMIDTQNKKQPVSAIQTSNSKERKMNKKHAINDTLKSNSKIELVNSPINAPSIIGGNGNSQENK